MIPLTICYITSRKDPKIEWFLDSLRKQAAGLAIECLRVVVVSFHDLDEQGSSECRSPLEVIWTRSKPSVWQGPHRLTKENYFAASNARNTGLCLAPDGWIAYVDDLSVLMPGWLDFVVSAVGQNTIYLGAYRKVKELVVEEGEVKSFKEYPGGRDSRWNRGHDNKPMPVDGDAMFGCSFVGPVEAFLTVGGFPEFVDGMSFEDVLMGIAMQNAGFKFAYVRKMLTLESEELHHVEPAFKRTDKGISPADKSHAALNMVKSGCKYFENYYEGGIRKMREEVLSGKPFPVVQIPEFDWFDGKPLRDM